LSARASPAGPITHAAQFDQKRADLAHADPMPRMESVMALTGKFKFRKTLWGRIVLQVEEGVKPFWRRSKPGPLKRRWRDTTLMDLTVPEISVLRGASFCCLHYHE
jgi:hypothetical protein